MEYSNLFVCLMGLGIVFFGLICIILLTYLMSYCCRDRKRVSIFQAGTPSAQSAVSAVPAAGRQAMIAAISAAIAEDRGTDLSGIRILSVKKL